MVRKIASLILVALASGLLLACGTGEPGSAGGNGNAGGSNGGAKDGAATQPTLILTNAPAQAGGSSAGYSRPLTRKDGAAVEGDDVTAVQRRLIELGYADFSEPTGNYGPKTESAVIAFQQASGLDTDGVVGPKTWAALFGAAAVAKNTPPAGAATTTPPSQGDPAAPPSTASATATSGSPTAVSQGDPAEPPSQGDPADPPAGAAFGLPYHLLYVNREQDAIIEEVPDDQPQTFGKIDLKPGEEVAYFLADQSGTWAVYGIRPIGKDTSRLYKQQRGGEAQFVDIIYGWPSLNGAGQIAYQVADIASAGAPPYQTIIHTLADGASKSLERNGAAPRWTPGGDEVVYVEDGNLIEAAIAGGGDGLTSLPKDGDGSWAIQEGLMLPDGSFAFYGGPALNVGITGNNRGWYKTVNKAPAPWFPELGAELAAPVALNASTNTLAYAVTVRGGPCTRNDGLHFLPLDGQPFDVDVIDQQPGQSLLITDLSWDPATANILAISAQPYVCQGGEKALELPGIYLLPLGDGTFPLRVAEGWFGTLIK